MLICAISLLILIICIYVYACTQTVQKLSQRTSQMERGAIARFFLISHLHISPNWIRLS